MNAHRPQSVDIYIYIYTSVSQPVACKHNSMHMCQPHVHMAKLVFHERQKQSVHEQKQKFTWVLYVRVSRHPSLCLRSLETITIAVAAKL